MEYIQALNDATDDCFLCRYVPQADRDAENLVLWRGERTLVVMNRFPYSSGHLLVAPTAHVGTLNDLDTETMTEIMLAVRDGQNVLQQVIHPDGFNVGINLGRCAGAGLPGHLHVHIVPRWDGDTNFMTVMGDVRVIPQSLDKLYSALRERAEQLGLRRG